MSEYTHGEAQFVSDLVDGMLNVGYTLISAVCISNEDMPFCLNVDRAQNTTLLFVGPQYGTALIFDYSTTARGETNRTTLRLTVHANFRRDAHTMFHEKWFTSQMGCKAKLQMKTLPMSGTFISKSVTDRTGPRRQHSYFNIWEFMALSHVEPGAVVTELAPMLQDLDQLTQPLRMLMISSLPPSSTFAGCKDLFWTRFRENMNVEAARPILSAMRST